MSIENADRKNIRAFRSLIGSSRTAAGNIKVLKDLEDLAVCVFYRYLGPKGPRGGRSRSGSGDPELQMGGQARDCGGQAPALR